MKQRGKDNTVIACNVKDCAVIAVNKRSHRITNYSTYVYTRNETAQCTRHKTRNIGCNVAWNCSKWCHLLHVQPVVTVLILVVNFFSSFLILKEKHVLSFWFLTTKTVLVKLQLNKSHKHMVKSLPTQHKKPAHHQYKGHNTDKSREETYAVIPYQSSLSKVLKSLNKGTQLFT